MAPGANTEASAVGHSCFNWIAALPCLSRHNSLNEQNGAQKAKTSSAQQERGSVQWTLGPNAAELLRVVFPELHTARHFFKRFIADDADFTVLEADFAPWNEYMLTSDGELEKWADDRTRLCKFLAYPVPPGWVPFQKYILEIEQRHRYQFVMDRSSGVELLQFEKFIQVNQKMGHVPYADCFTMRQLWTIRPASSSGSCDGGCELHVEAECTFIGRPPLVAAVIRNRATADHRNGTQDWLRGARASLDRNASASSESSLVIDEDSEDPGADGMVSPARHLRPHKNVLRFACPWAWLMTFLVCMLWITFVAVEVGNQVMPNPVKVAIDPIYPSMLLSVRGLLAL